MAIRYKAVNASVTIEASDISVVSNTRFDIAFFKTIYTVPQGCTAKVNYIRSGHYNVLVDTVNSTNGATSLAGIGNSFPLSIRTNGKILRDIIKLSESVDQEMDTSTKFLYLNAGDELCTIDNRTWKPSSTTISATGSPYITDEGFLYISIIEEYQS